MSLLTAVTLLGLTSNSQSLTTTSTTIRRSHINIQPRTLFSTTSTQLFVGDFSSHPYATYYGTSGSTAQQNLSQNDEMADMYGYHENGMPPPPPDAIDPMYADYYNGPNTHLDSMQGGLRPPNMRDAMRDGLLQPGPIRRGDFRPGLPPPLPRNNDMMDRVQERHMLDRLDELLFQHDTLRERLDQMETRVDENQRLQQEQTDTILNAVSQEHVESTKAMMENVLDELRNVQASLNMVQGKPGASGRVPGVGSPPQAASSNFGAPPPGSPPQSPPRSQQAASSNFGAPPPASPGSPPRSPQSPPASPQQPPATAASPGATSSTIPPGSSTPPPITPPPPSPQQAGSPPPQATQQAPPPKPQINTTPPQEMRTGMGAEDTNPQNPTYFNQGPPPPHPEDEMDIDDMEMDHDDMDHEDAMNSFQQRAVGMRQPPPPPPRPTEPRRKTLRDRIYEQKGRGENEVPYGPTAGQGGPMPPPPNGSGMPPRAPPGMGQGGGAPGFSTQGSVRSMDGTGGGFGGRQAPPPQQQQQRGPPINGGHASAGPPPGYFDDDEEGAEDIWPKGGVNTFEPGQGPGQQQRSYERSAHRGATRSNSFGNFGGQQQSVNGAAPKARGRMSGFGGSGMGMGQGSGRSGGSTRSFGEESGSMTFTEGPDGGRCFLT